jgi:hypothetical protein
MHTKQLIVPKFQVWQKILLWIQDPWKKLTFIMLQFVFGGTPL